MSIVEPVIRPPAEADSFLLQVTLGCSADSCSFCGAYKSKTFRVKDRKEITADINWYARRYQYARRVFLMDGDALVLANSKLVPILEELDAAFPRLTRISSYANGCNITRKNNHELAELYKYKLSLIYMGLESGNQGVLDRCGKSSSVEEMIEAVNKAAKVRDCFAGVRWQEVFRGACQRHRSGIKQDAAKIPFVPFSNGNSRHAAGGRGQKRRI